MLSIEASYLYAQRLTKARAKNFYYAFRFLSPERRRSIFSVYAFSRRADDTVDAVEEGTAQPEEARRGLEALRGLLGGPPPDDPLTPALRDTIEKYRIPLRPFQELLAGMEMDLVKKSYETFDELYLYCYRVASVVGLISLEIFGHSGHEVEEPAVKLGIAMQLTNILRDVAEDLQRGRRYIPREEMERFSYGDEDLRRRIVDDRFRALMRFEVDRARRFFREAEPLFPQVIPESRYCPVLLKRFYSRILDRIERGGYDVFSTRPRLSTAEKLLLAGRLWLESRRRR
jgi:phytoene synthase